MELEGATVIVIVELDITSIVVVEEETLEDNLDDDGSAELIEVVEVAEVMYVEDAGDADGVEEVVVLLANVVEDRNTPL